MDYSDEDEISYQSKIEQLFLKPLTPYQIACAFPECKQLANKTIDICKDYTRYFVDEIDDADKEEWFWLQILKAKMEANPLIKKINFYKKYLSHLSYSNNNNHCFDVEKARNVPIMDLYNFEKMKKTSTRTTALCPFHDEKIGSFVVYHKENKFHCFGCMTHGDSISFLMKLKGLSFIDAVKCLGGNK